MGDSNRDIKRENRRGQERSEAAEKIAEENRQSNDNNQTNQKDQKSDETTAAQQTVKNQFDKDNPVVIAEDGKAKQIADRVQQAVEYSALSDSLSSADTDGNRNLSKDELIALSTSSDADPNARRGAQNVLDRYDTVANFDKGSEYHVTENVGYQDLEILARERLLEAAQIRGLHGLDKDGDGKATADELVDAALNSQSKEDREIAYALYGRVVITPDVLPDENSPPAPERGITQNDLDFRVEKFKENARYDNLECTEALNAFPELKKSGLRPEDIKSIIDNENRKRGFEDWFQDNIGQPWGDPTVGEAQIKKSTIALLKRDYPQVAELDEYDPNNGPIFMAAFLDHQCKQLNAGSFGELENEHRANGKSGLADRVRDMQQDWNSKDSECMRRGLIQSVNPGSPNAEHYTVIVDQSNSRPAIPVA